MLTIQEFERRREDAMKDLRIWWERNWDRPIKTAPMWRQYMAACEALEKARERLFKPVIR